MAKQDIKKLLDDASAALDLEYDNQVDAVRAEIKTFKAKTLDKIQKNIP